jgi:hypothetical protein
VPLIASSKTLVEMVVLIGTPSLLVTRRQENKEPKTISFFHLLKKKIANMK